MRRHGKRRGQTLVESALALVAFLALAVTVIDVGQVILARALASDRLRDVARFAAMHPDDAGAIRGRAAAAGFEAGKIRIERRDRGERIVVIADRLAEPHVSPWLSGGEVTIEASAMVER